MADETPMCDEIVSKTQADWGQELIDFERRIREQMQREAWALIDAVRPLMQRDVVQPFWSAWEIDTNSADGEKLYDRLRTAWEAAMPAIPR